MTTRYESCIAFILITDLAHFRLGTRSDCRLLCSLSGHTDHFGLMFWLTYWQVSLISYVMLMMFERLFHFFLVFDKHELSFDIDLIANLTWNSYKLHLLTLKILATGKLLAILGSLVDNWHIF